MDRRSRGRRKSSNCIQSCLTFSFLRFMADPGKKVDSRKLKVKERQDSRKKRQNTENTECRGTKSTGGDDNSRDMGGPKNKNAPTGSGRTFLQRVAYQNSTWFVKREMQKKTAGLEKASGSWRQPAWESRRFRRGLDCWSRWRGCRPAFAGTCCVPRASCPRFRRTCPARGSRA